MNEQQRQRAILLQKTGRPLYQVAMIVGCDPDELHELFRKRLEDGIRRSIHRGESFEEIAETFSVEVDYVRRLAG
jgi:hypothetical protein